MIKYEHCAISYDVLREEEHLGAINSLCAQEWEVWRADSCAIGRAVIITYYLRREVK